MVNRMNQKIQKDIKKLKHKCLIIKIKWFLLFVLPILAVVLAYQVSKQFLKIKVKELNRQIKENGIHHDASKQSES